jgi:hypothetical protein
MSEVNVSPSLALLCTNFRAMDGIEGRSLASSPKTSYSSSGTNLPAKMLFSNPNGRHKKSVILTSEVPYLNIYLQVSLSIHFPQTTLCKYLRVRRAWPFSSKHIVEHERSLIMYFSSNLPMEVTTCVTS